MYNQVKDNTGQMDLSFKKIDKLEGKEIFISPTLPFLVNLIETDKKTIIVVLSVVIVSEKS